MMHSDMPAAILALAVLWDAAAGEYPPRLHPVVWMGQAISCGLRLAPRSGWWPQFCFGTALALVIVALSAGVSALAMWGGALVWPLEILIGTYLFKGSFALRALGQAARRVIGALEAGNIAGAREALRSLCSRDPSELTETELLAATIESVAENTSDSFVAPLFYYLLLGVPGAVAYRAINTLDAMIGYRGQFEALGKFSARLDDLVNLIPARLTALLFLGSGWIWGGTTRAGWRILRRDGASTPSPNGGRAMAAMAGLLTVRLEKQGVYALGDATMPLTCDKVRQAWGIALTAGWGMILLCLLVLAMRAVV